MCEKLKKLTQYYLVTAEEIKKIVDLPLPDVALHQRAIVIQQMSRGILGQKVISDLRLHERKICGDVLIERFQFQARS